MVNKLFTLAIICLIAGIVSAQTGAWTALDRLIGVGIKTEWATEIDSNYVGQVSGKRPVVVVTPALTPSFRYGPVNVVPTFAANGAGLMPVPTPGNSLSITNTGANAHLAYPGANALGTPVAIYGAATPVARGTPAPIPSGKTFQCVALNVNDYACQQGF